MIKEENYIVSKKHSLVLCQYDLTLTEQKLICWLACKVEMKDKEFKKYNLSIKDFIKGLGTKDQTKYSTLPEIAKNLMRKVFEIEDGKTTHILSWLSCASYTKGSGIITLEFSPSLKNYLLELKDFYVQYKLWNVLKLRNKFSIGMYEFLKCKQFEYGNKKVLEVSLVDIKKYINCTNKSYNIYGNFNSKVLKKTQMELMKYTDIKFTYKPVKKGAKYDGLKIYITKNVIPQLSDAGELYDQIGIGDSEEIYKNALEDPKKDPIEDPAGDAAEDEYNIMMKKIMARDKN
jgi:plasmid replication initiation protein